MAIEIHKLIATMRANGLIEESYAVGELFNQRGELLDSLKMVQEAAVDMRGEDFNLTIEQWSIFHAVIANSEK